MKRDSAFQAVAKHLFILGVVLALAGPAWANGEEFFAPAKNGKIDLEFFGLKIRGAFVLTQSSREPSNWLLIKRNDHFADPEWKLETVLPVKQKAAGGKR